MLLGVLLWMNKKDEDKKSAELQALNAKLYQEEQEKEAALKQKKAEDSFYQKLSDGFDVNVLVVGDSIGAGAGTETDGQQWFKQLQAYLRTVNKASVSVTNVSMGGNTSYAGYVQTMALDDDIDYDLAVICYGQNDALQGLDVYYEAIVQAIKNKYPNCSIISILESSQRDYTSNIITIQSICDHYGIPVADTIVAFNNSGKAYDDLSNDGVHPNDAGQEIYYETVKNVIDENVAASTGKMENVDAINADVHKFDNFIWYGADKDFKRVDDTTFTLNASASGVFGMSYTEIRNGFLNAAMLSEDIKSFRKERLEEHITEMKKPFALVQVIPATFRSDCVPMYDLYREGKLNFDDLFNGMIYDRAVPNVDGVYFPDYSEQRNFEQLQIFNTGAVELKMDFEIREQNSRSQQLKTERYLIIFDFEAELRKLIQGTSKMYQKLGRSTAMYVCVTIVGCKGLWNYTVNAYGANAPTKVDRNQIVCTPIEIRNIQDDVQVKEGIENCIRMTKYSLGIRI